MKGTRYLLFAVIFVALASAFSAASDIYFAQNAAGSNNGTSCANAYAYNDAKHGLGVSGTWAAGANLHICGTWSFSSGTSTPITVQASGSAGNPITLKFEPGAVITAPYWSVHVIEIGQNSYITVDGGTNGTIQASANGSALANQQDYGECVANSNFSGAISNVIVQNLICSNLYVDSSLADNGGQDTYGIDVFNCSNCTFQNNTIHDVKWAIRTGWMNGFSFSNVIVTGNNIYNIDHGWFGSDNEPTGNATVSGVYVYGNTLGSMANWDNTLDLNHHDWFHLNATSATSSITNFYLYNNYGSGDVGAFGGGGFFSYPDHPGTESGLYIFNNVFVNTSTTNSWAVGFVAEYNVGTTLVANNTFVSNAASPTKDNGIHSGFSSPGLTSVNNILQNIVNVAVYVDPTAAPTAIDYNGYYLSPSWFKSGSWYSTLPNWSSGTGYDSHATVGNPKLTSNYHLTDNTSSAWKTGQSLYSTCNGQPSPGLGALCSDKAGVARQSTGPWDMGAYEDSVSGGGPPPPNGLVAVVQ